MDEELLASAASGKFLTKTASKLLKKGKFWNQSGIRWGAVVIPSANTRDDLTTYQ